MRIHIGSFQVHFAIDYRPLKTMTGVNSLLNDGTHFLMWDFDNVSEHDVYATLEDIQVKYTLPTIYVMYSGSPLHYHAYCFYAQSFADTLHILFDTEHCDEMYRKIGIMRGYFTLRISPKGQAKFSKCPEITSRVHSNMGILDIRHFISYETRRG